MFCNVERHSYVHAMNSVRINTNNLIVLMCPSVSYDV
uniref:Uncharacterized protein n=1 Tax=Anguilla anguilla TaxID=7936 RepID=A0A0E9WRQ5_ANGAN